MTQYQLKVTPLTAIQVAAGWFDDANPFANLPANCSPDPTTRKITVPTGSGNFSASIGDWILTWADGTHTCMTDAQFLADYEATP